MHTKLCAVGDVRSKAVCNLSCQYVALHYAMLSAHLALVIVRGVSLYVSSQGNYCLTCDMVVHVVPCVQLCATALACLLHCQFATCSPLADNCCVVCTAADGSSRLGRQQMS